MWVPLAVFLFHAVSLACLSVSDNCSQASSSSLNDFEQTFLSIDSFISAENSAFALLRPAWQACVHYATVDTASTEQLFCAIAILRKTLTVLRRTVSESLVAHIDEIEQWCQSLTSLALSEDGAEKTSSVLRSVTARKKKKKRSDRLALAALACATAAGGLAWWSYHKTHKPADDVVVFRLNGSGRSVHGHCAGQLVPAEAVVTASRPQTADDLVAELVERLHTDAESDLQMGDVPAGQQWVPLLSSQRLHSIAEGVPIKIHAVDGARMLVDTPEPEMHARLLLAARLGTEELEPIFRSEKLQNEELLRKRFHAWDPAPADKEQAQLYKRTKLLEIVNNQRLCELYIAKELSNYDGGFIGFCRYMFARRALSAKSAVRWQLVHDFKQVFMAHYAAEVERFLQEGMATVAYDKEITFRAQLQATEDELFELNQFATVCCKSLSKAVFLLEPGIEQRSFFERIITVGTVGLTHDVAQKRISGKDQSAYARLSCIGCLWSLPGKKVGQASMNDVLSVALRIYKQGLMEIKSAARSAAGSGSDAILPDESKEREEA